MEFIEFPKRTPNWPGICQWNPPSQTFYTSIRTCINCWNLSNVRPASVAGSICDTFQDFNRFKFQRCENSPPRFTAGVGNELQTDKNWSNGHLQVGPKKYHIHDSMTDWKMINIFAVLLPQKISKDRVLSILKIQKRNWTGFLTSGAVGFMPAERMASPSRDTGSWPDSCGTTMVKYFTSGNTCHFQCGFTWDLQFFKPFLGWPKWRTRTQLDFHITRKSRKVACLLASRRFAELNLRKATAKLKSAIVNFQPPEINLYHSGVHTHPNHFGF